MKFPMPEVKNKTLSRFCPVLATTLEEAEEGQIICDITEADPNKRRDIAYEYMEKLFKSVPRGLTLMTNRPLVTISLVSQVFQNAGRVKIHALWTRSRERNESGHVKIKVLQGVVLYGDNIPPRVLIARNIKDMKEVADALYQWDTDVQNESR